MKKLVLFLAAAALSLSAAADEGMWLLPYLQKNIKQMKERGCKLTAEEIYSLNEAALKDAIVIFGNGCTGEIVSDRGLLFTNHHCGYGSIQALSSVEHDYLKYGFWARSNAEELPAPGLTVRFIRRIIDVTADLTAGVPSIASEAERERIVAEATAALAERLGKEYEGREIEIKPFFGGNQYFAFVVDRYTDVRLVGTPPSSIGKFGGDTDNWMWPRHTGDFSVFRVYADKEGRPAPYSPDNEPLTTPNHLTISLDGYGMNDFAMIMGFPGSTERYMTSYEIENLLEVENPTRIFIRGERQAILKEDMAASDRVRIQYASKYAVSSNYWKNSIGMSRGIEKLDVKGKKEAQEAAYQQWADANTLPEERLAGALGLIREAEVELTTVEGELQVLQEAFFNAVELMAPVNTFAGKTKITDPEKAKSLMAGWYKDYNAPTDRKVAKRMLHIVRERMSDLPDFYAEIIDKEYGGDIDAYVDYVYDNSAFASQEKLNALLDDFSAERVDADPATPMVKSVMAKYNELTEKAKPARAKFAEGHRLYIAGLMRMQPDKAMYPDANFTLRLTYGQVLPYRPADGVTYNYYTTLKGVMEKENPESDEFVVPARLKELYAARDFGRYANAEGEMPVAFLANCDITGGNSGSPVMNARGQLIGLAFDGNWEAMSGDVAFEPELQRTICVDVRYVLFVIDKFAGAGWLLDEMDIVQKHAPRSAR